MKKNILFFVLFVPVIFLLFWVLILHFQVRTFKEVTLPIEGYDPRDLLSGRYIAYQIDWEKANCRQFENFECPKEEFCKEERWGRQCRFYVSEQKAYALDTLFRDRSDDGRVFEVVYAYKKGRTPIAKNLFINGQDWQKFVEISAARS